MELRREDAERIALVGGEPARELMLRLFDEVAEQGQRLGKLERKAGQNSQNSSMPPSKDGLASLAACLDRGCCLVSSPMAASDSKRDAIEVAARPLRELLREEHDQIAAAQRALRQAEKAHNRAIELAERQLRAAKTAKPLAAYGHHVILYADRVSTADGNHDLTPAVRARIETRPEEGRSHRREMTLTIAAPTWRREIAFPRQDERRIRRLAEEIELAARNVDVIRGAARAETEQADQDLGEARADRRAVQETRALIHQLSDLVYEDEELIDMAPGISAGHDGVLVATDRRLLFISVRRTLSFPYEQVSSVEVKGKWFGARLALSTPSVTGVFSGLAPRHATEIAELVRGRIGSGTAAL